MLNKVNISERRENGRQAKIRAITFIDKKKDWRDVRSVLTLEIYPATENHVRIVCTEQLHPPSSRSHNYKGDKGSQRKNDNFNDGFYLFIYMEEKGIKPFINIDWKSPKEQKNVFFLLEQKEISLKISTIPERPNCALNKTDKLS